VVGRVQNNNYEKDGQMVYTMAFTAQEIDYLDSKTEGEALRAKQGPAPQDGAPVPAGKPAARGHAAKPVNGRKAAKAPAAEEADDIPF
jgi:single-strand DNA-binding protein